MMDGDTTQITFPFNNWGICSIVVKKGTKIGVLEEVTGVNERDECDWALTLLHFVIVELKTALIDAIWLFSVLITYIHQFGYIKLIEQVFNL